ncbi:hypothetical protein PENTCL1PPCAC_10549, partial [Pristionchus entomophagus]
WNCDNCAISMVNMSSLTIHRISTVQLMGLYIFTISEPHVLLSSKWSSTIPRKLSIHIAGIPNQVSEKLHYAGSHNNGELFFERGMYFYTKKAGLLFEQNYILINMNVFNMYCQPRMRETESPNVIFFHRQPYYLLRLAKHSFVSSKHWIFRSGCSVVLG